MEELRFRQGAGRICLDFIRTLRYRGSDQQVEELPDAEAATAWLAQMLPPLQGLTLTPAQARDARRLRDAIYELLIAGIGPGVASCRASARERVNRAALAPVPSPRLGPAGQMAWYADDPVAASFALIARDALDLVASPLIHRVRGCGGTLCRALFLDTSRPGVRRWCSMDGCGNQAKKATLRSKDRPDKPVPAGA